MTTETTETNPRNGSINAGLTTGIIGTALGVMNAVGNGVSLFGNNTRNGSQYITKDEFCMGQQLAKKDSEIALLQSEKADEKKMVEVYTELNRQITGVKDTVAANRDRADDRLANAVERLNGKIDFNKNQQDSINAQQLAYNGTNGATLACMQNQIAQLQGMTKLVIPNTSVCPGWGSVTISPATLSA